MRKVLGWFVVISLGLGGNWCTAAPIAFTVNTATLDGVHGILAFDFINGGPPTNSVTISAFSTDGTVGASSSTGDVTGSLPGAVTLGDTQFFNEYLQNILLGTTLGFTFAATANSADSASFPDSFALFLLDPLTLVPLFETSDPTGANALFLYDIGTQSPLAIYSSSVTQAVGPNEAPEPPTLWLLGLMLVAITCFRGALAPSSSVARTCGKSVDTTSGIPQPRRQAYIAG